MGNSPEADAGEVPEAEETTVGAAHQAQLAVDGGPALVEPGTDLVVVVGLVDDAFVQALEAPALAHDGSAQELDLETDVENRLALLEQGLQEVAVATGDLLQVVLEAGLEIEGEVGAQRDHLGKLQGHGGSSLVRWRRPGA